MRVSPMGNNIAGNLVRVQYKGQGSPYVTPIPAYATPESHGRVGGWVKAKRGGGKGAAPVCYF